MKILFILKVECNTYLIPAHVAAVDESSDFLQAPIIAVIPTIRVNQNIIFFISFSLEINYHLNYQEH